MRLWKGGWGYIGGLLVEVRLGEEVVGEGVNWRAVEVEAVGRGVEVTPEGC